MEFSALLQKLIRISNVKPQVLADRMGYDVSYISKWPVSYTHLFLPGRQLAE